MQSMITVAHWRDCVCRVVLRDGVPYLHDRCTRHATAGTLAEFWTAHVYTAHVHSAEARATCQDDRCRRSAQKLKVAKKTQGDLF